MSWNDPHPTNPTSNPQPRKPAPPRPDRNHHRATPLDPLPQRLAANDTFWIQRGPKRQIQLFALEVCFFRFISSNYYLGSESLLMTGISAKRNEPCPHIPILCWPSPPPPMGCEAFLFSVLSSNKEQHPWRQRDDPAPSPIRCIGSPCSQRLH